MDDSYADLIAAKQVWINKREGELAGVLVCQITDDHLLVRTVGILPEYQGCGLGSELMKYAETLARDAAIGVMRLYTNEVMTGNVEFYEWLGYLETHRKGPDAKQVVYMMKVL